MVEKVVKILKLEVPPIPSENGQASATDDGSVTQRFCIAILQKMSVKEEVIQVLLQRGLIQWVLRLLEKHRAGADIHIFSLDFSSALLANMLHSH